MVNITISIPEELYEKMKRHSEVELSEVTCKALVNYLNRLEIMDGNLVPMKEAVKKLKASGVDLSKIDLEAATKYYEESIKDERKGIFKTRDRKRLKLSDKEIQEAINRARKEKPRNK